MAIRAPEDAKPLKVAEVRGPRNAANPAKRIAEMIRRPVRSMPLR